MFRNRILLMSGLLFLLTTLHSADAADQEYVVSFIGGPSGLGLVLVNQTEKLIQPGLAAIHPMNKTMGSTAVDTYEGYWDYGLFYYVWEIHRADDEKNLEFGLVKFGGGLQPYDFSTFSKIPGQFHPLHLFRENETDSGGGGIPDVTSLLTTGNGTSGSNNYVSYLAEGGPRAKTRIFVNPDNRSPGTATVSPDGRLVSQMTYKGLNHIGLIGKLSHGKLEGSPVKWMNAYDFQGYSQSLSNPIPSTRYKVQKNGTRYLAYRNFRQHGTSNSASQIMIQNVDAITGKPQGSPRAITEFATARNVDAEKLQSIAISPDGRLILYTAWNDECKKQILLARRLVNGSSVGDPMVVVGCRQLEEYPLGVYGINMAPACPRVDYHSQCPQEKY